MANEPQLRDRIELLQGTLDLIILQTLGWGPRHGYVLALMISARSGERLQIDAGSIYPALHRLERQQWISATWGNAESKQHVRIYELTDAGKQQLTVERTRWEQFSEAIGGILAPLSDAPEAI